jgi:hypothetical protein
MTTPAEVRSFLAKHHDKRLLEQVSTALGATMNKAEAEFCETLLRSGYTKGYVALLGVTATLSLDAGAYIDASRATQEEEAVWEGYHRGLQSALACLLMSEMGYGPEEAGEMAVMQVSSIVGFRLVHGNTEQGG